MITNAGTRNLSSLQSAATNRNGAAFTRAKLDLAHQLRDHGVAPGRGGAWAPGANYDSASDVERQVRAAMNSRSFKPIGAAATSAKDTLAGATSPKNAGDFAQLKLKSSRTLEALDNQLSVPPKVADAAKALQAALDDNRSVQLPGKDKGLAAAAATLVQAMNSASHW